MFGRHKQIDILEEKKRTLDELTSQVESAVNIVTSVISGLELVNQQIDDTVAEIDHYTTNLDKTRTSLRNNRRHNEAIIANFSKLLSVDDEPTENVAI